MQSLIIFILANLTNQVNTLKHESGTEKPLGNTAQFAPYGLSTICVAKMIDNIYQYYLRFLLSSLYFSLAASALRIMRYCPKKLKKQEQRKETSEFYEPHAPNS